MICQSYKRHTSTVTLWIMKDLDMYPYLTQKIPPPCLVQKAMANSQQQIEHLPMFALFSKTITPPDNAYRTLHYAFYSQLHSMANHVFTYIDHGAGSNISSSGHLVLGIFIANHIWFEKGPAILQPQCWWRPGFIYGRRRRGWLKTKANTNRCLYPRQWEEAENWTCCFTWVSLNWSLTFRGIWLSWQHLTILLALLFGPLVIISSVNLKSQQCFISSCLVSWVLLREQMTAIPTKEVIFSMDYARQDVILVRRTKLVMHIHVHQTATGTLNRWCLTSIM